jgi:2'-5' RNA ligase
MAESALAVNVPELEPYVSAIRDRFDSSVKVGAPAHVTILYPFMAPGLITQQVLDAVQSTISSATSFAFRLSNLGRFTDTLYLAPEPAQPFIALTESLRRQFPDYSPYGGRHETFVPHLTAARGSECELACAQARISETLSSSGGIRAYCKEVVLIENSSGRWQHMHAFALSLSVELAG